jgi:general secretion pathway protein E
MQAEGISHGAAFVCESDGAQHMPYPAPSYLDLPYQIAQTNGLVIRRIAKDRIHVVMRCNAAPAMLLEISQILSLPIDLEIVSIAHFETCLALHYGTGVEYDAAIDSDNSGDDYDKIIELTDAMVASAITQNATDFHIEATENHLAVRVRQDGKLQEQFKMPMASSRAIISRYKSRSRLDSDLADRPQKGTMIFSWGTTELEISVSTLPGPKSERMVFHIPCTANSGAEFDLPGMSAEISSQVRHILSKSGGLIIVAGQIDASVSNTLYTALELLNDGRRNIMTIESKVEVAIDGISQIAVGRAFDDDKKHSKAITDTLRAVLLQDPDVVMIDQVKDRKTAEMAMQAALKGPLVLTAMDCRSAIEVITALRELKIDNMLIGEALRGVIAQRQVKQLCSACRAPSQAAGSIASRLGFDRGTGIFEPRGCDVCDQSGYSGHIGVFEFVAIDDTLRRLISSGGDVAVISSYAFMNNPNLSSAARRLVISGETTAEEAIRIGQNS